MQHRFNLKLLICMALLLPAVFVQAKTCELTISGNDMIMYNKSELRVDTQCDAVKLTLKHTGMLTKNQMGHNWVLAETGQWKDIAKSSLMAGEANGYVPPDDERILASTPTIGGGNSTSITFDLAMFDREKYYTFFCTFPGHWANMNGAFILESTS